MLAAVLAAATGDGIGASDCELLRDATLAQPVNALTSLAYVVTGAVVIATARRRHRPFVSATVFGSCLIAVGIGSALFHGPQPAGSRLLHDLPIIVTVLFVLVHDLDVVRPGRVRPWPTFAAAVAAATILTAAAPAVATAVTGVGVAAIVILEVVIARRRRAGPRDGRDGRLGWVVFVLAAVAATTWVLGRSAGPACDPDAIFQFHGLWHVLSAVVLGLWWDAAFPPSTPTTATGATG
jgi:hypothetical protein